MCVVFNRANTPHGRCVDRSWCEGGWSKRKRWVYCADDCGFIPEFQNGETTVNFIDNHPELFNFKKGQDRSTKALTFLGNVIVNGNKDIKSIDHTKVFSEQKIPDFDKYMDYPKGTKDLLREYGRDGFIDWLKSQVI